MTPPAFADVAAVAQARPGVYAVELRPVRGPFLLSRALRRSGWVRVVKDGVEIEAIEWKPKPRKPRKLSVHPLAALDGMNSNDVRQLRNRRKQARRSRK